VAVRIRHDAHHRQDAAGKGGSHQIGGEKRSPLPWLSVGASVSGVVAEGAVLGGATQVTAVEPMDRRNRVTPQGARGLPVGCRPVAPTESPSSSGACSDDSATSDWAG
jgi:hypothetical protein